MTTRPFAALAVVLLAFAAVADCSSTNQGPAKASPSSKRQYAHPARDLARVTAGCDSDKKPYVTLWITNHSAHAMAYDIKYSVVDAHGQPTGSARGVFTLSAHQVLADTRLFDTTGHCGTHARLAYVNAYNDDGHGDEQPSF